MTNEFNIWYPESNPYKDITYTDVSNGIVYYHPKIKRGRKPKIEPEENVRQYYIIKLIKELGYAPEDIEIEYAIRKGGGYADIILRYPEDFVIERYSGQVFALIECKTKDEYDSKLDAWIEDQVIPYSTASETHPQYGILATAYKQDGEIKEKITCINFQDVAKVETRDGKKLIDWEGISYKNWVKKGKPQIKEIYKNYDIKTVRPLMLGDLNSNITEQELNKIRIDLHNKLWSKGLADTEIFNNITKIFLAKIYDEKTITKTEPEYKFQRLYKQDKDGNYTEPESLQELLQRINVLYKNGLQQYLHLSEEDVKDEKINLNKLDYEGIEYVVDKLKDISLTSNKNYDMLGKFFEDIIWSGFKQKRGMFFTHTNIVNFIIKSLGFEKVIKERIKNACMPSIIDPACGSGTFLIEVMKYATEVARQVDKRELSEDARGFVDSSFADSKKYKWAEKYIYGVDISPDLSRAAKVNMVMHGDGSLHIDWQDGLKEFSVYHGILSKSKKGDDIYPKATNEQFDFVISNPPYSSPVSALVINNFALGELFKANRNGEIKNKSIEILFLERFYQLLASKGRLGVLLPESLFDVGAYKEVRLWLFKHFYVRAVISLPRTAFEPYTLTKISILIAEKKTEEEIKEYQDRWDAKYAELRDADKEYTDYDIFKEISKQLDYPIFMSIAPNERTLGNLFMGYKRGSGDKAPENLLERRMKNKNYGLYNEVDENDTKTILSDIMKANLWDYSPSRVESISDFSFITKFSNIANQRDLRIDSKYRYFWDIKNGICFNKSKYSIKPLGEALEVVKKSPKLSKGPLGESMPILDLEDVEVKTGDIINEKEVEEIGSTKLIFGNADILIGKLDTEKGHILINDKTKKYIGTTEWVPYKIREKNEIDYVFYILTNNQFLKNLNYLTSGKTHPRVQSRDLLNIKIPLPDQEEQQNIIKKIKPLKEKLKDYKKKVWETETEIEQSISKLIA